MTHPTVAYFLSKIVKELRSPWARLHRDVLEDVAEKDHGFLNLS
jgi:hypothetical protein